MRDIGDLVSGPVPTCDLRQVIQVAAVSFKRKIMNPNKREGGDTLVERQLLFHEKYWNEEGVRFSLMREASTRKWLKRSVHAYHVNIDSHCPVPCSIYSLVVVSRYSYPLISRFLPHLPCPLLLLKAYYSRPVIRLFFSTRFLNSDGPDDHVSGGQYFLC